MQATIPSLFSSPLQSSHYFTEYHLPVVKLVTMLELIRMTGIFSIVRPGSSTASLTSPLRLALQKFLDR
jgi:hypothetical protein